MHQAVGQLARVGEQQQTFGVEVKPAHRLPLTLHQARQAAEHGGPVLRVVMTDHFARRLVISQHAGRRWRHAHAYRLAVDLDDVTVLDALAHVGRLAVDGDAPFKDELLHLQA